MIQPRFVPEMPPFTPTLRALENIRNAVLRIQRNAPVNDYEFGAMVAECLEVVDRALMEEVTKDDPNSELAVALRASKIIFDMDERLASVESSVSGLLGREIL